MVVTDPEDAGERHRGGLRSDCDGRCHRVLAVRRGRGYRRGAGGRGVRGIRAPRVADRRRVERHLGLAADHVPGGHAHAVRGADTAGHRMRCDVHHNPNVRRRDSGTRDTRFLKTVCARTSCVVFVFGLGVRCRLENGNPDSRHIPIYRKPNQYCTTTCVSVGVYFLNVFVL